MMQQAMMEQQMATPPKKMPNEPNQGVNFGGGQSPMG